MAETPEQLIGFAKGKLSQLKGTRKLRELWGGKDRNLDREIRIYEGFLKAFLESHGVEVEKDG